MYGGESAKQLRTMSGGGGGVAMHPQRGVVQLVRDLQPSQATSGLSLPLHTKHNRELLHFQFKKR